MIVPGTRSSVTDMHGVVVVDSDAKLWDRAARGDPAAFGDLFERHARAVYNLCFRRTADWALAEDLTSATFLQAWRRRGDARISGESLLPWLYGVATNVIRNDARGLRRRSAAVARLFPPGEQADFADDLAGRVDDERRMRSVLEMVRHLPRREQDVLALCVWQGLPYEDAATALGVPVGTVRSRLSRARQRVRELAGAGGHDQGVAGNSVSGRRKDALDG